MGEEREQAKEHVGKALAHSQRARGPGGGAGARGKPQGPAQRLSIGRPGDTPAPRKDGERATLSAPREKIHRAARAPRS